MNQFKTPLRVELAGEQLFRVTDILHYSNKKLDIFILSGFEFDGASIPKSLWSVYGCPFGGLYTLASCLHDALYSTHLFGKADADRLFYEAMIASGVDRRTAIQMYLAVRAFGQSAYDEKYELAKNREFVGITLKGEQ
jgi:hypothetical protein